MSSIGASFRLLRAGWVILREGVVASVPRENLSGSARTLQRFAALFAKRKAGADRQERLARAIYRLGPSYIKLGQFLATRPDIVGKDLSEDFSRLQDRMETFPKADAIQAIEGSLGRTIQDLFVHFDEPIAAASIAQVHPATVAYADGERVVAVKVIRPGVRQRFQNDLESYFLLARLQERFFEDAKRLKPVEVTQSLAQTTRIEMDLRLEAAALSELKENTKDDPGFRVPAVDWERTGRDVVTMEWVDGVKMSDIDGLRAAGHDLQKLAATLIQSFLRQTLRDGFFHADMHPGNLFVDADGTIVAVDLGIAGRLGKKERHFLAEILYGFITRDYLRVAQVHFEAGYVPRRHDVASFAQAIRAIGEPIHGQSAETISMAKLLTLLFEVTQVFDMETRTELLLLQKTMVVVEGVARTLDPAFNMWKTAEPVVGAWIADNLGPRGMLRDAGEGLRAVAHLARQLPDFAARTQRLSEAIDKMALSGLRFDAQTAEAIGKAEARHTRSGRIALWVMAISLAAIAIRLL
ncbi:MAG: 2-polyprenylphenol 6-hydroxylase [Rhizobiaceae bacterium]